MPKDTPFPAVRHRTRNAPGARDIVGRGGGGKGGAPNVAKDNLSSMHVVKLLEALCEGPVKSISPPYFDGTPLVGDDGKRNFQGVTYETRRGLPDQLPVTSIKSQDTEIGIDAIVLQATPIVRRITDPDTDSAKVQIKIPGMFKRDTENGDIDGTRLEYRVQYRPDGATNWIEATGSPFVLNDKKASSPVFRVHKFPLSGSAPWDVRVVRVTPDSEDQTVIANELYFFSLTQCIDQKFTYPHTALAAITAHAEQFGTSIPTRGYLVEGLICRVPSNFNPETRTYSGVWDGRFVYAWTDCPAWCTRELIRNMRWGLGNYIPVDMLTDTTLYAISQYCAQRVPDGTGGTEPRFTFNAYIATLSDAYQLLNNMVSVFRGMVYYSMGQIYFTTDGPRDPELTVTRANTVNGEFTYRGASLTVQHNRINVTYNDPTNNYKREIVTVEDPDSIHRYGLRPSNIVAFGCTSKTQAMRVGRWLLYTERMESETLNYVAGPDHIDVAPGSIVRVMDPSQMGVSMGGRLANYGASQVTLDRTVTLLGGQTYELVVADRNRRLHYRAVTSAPGARNVIAVGAALPDLPDDPKEVIWALKRTNGPDTLWRVLASAEVGPDQFDITAIRHEPSKYAIIENNLDIPDFPAPLLPTGPLPVPRNLRVRSYTSPNAGAGDVVNTSVSVSRLADPRVRGMEIAYRRMGQAWRSVDLQADTETEITNLVSGARYAFRARSYDGTGRTSNWSATLIEELDGVPPRADIPGVSMPTIISGFQQITVRWQNPAISNFRTVEVWTGATNNLGAATLTTRTSSERHTIGSLQSGQTVHIWVRVGVHGSTNMSPYQYLGFGRTTQIGDDDLGDSVRDTMGDIATRLGIRRLTSLTERGDFPNQIGMMPDGTLYRWDPTANGGQGAWVTSLYAGIAPGSLDITKFASGLAPVTLHPTASPLPTARITDALFWRGDLYRWNGTAYVKTVPAIDIIGEITAAQIGTGAVLESKLAANAVTVEKVALAAITAGRLASGAVTNEKLADGALSTAKFAAGLRPVELVASLPTSGNVQGRTVTLSTDGKLYRYHNGQWTSAVPATDIAGQLAAAQIAAVAAASVTGQLTNAQIADVAAAKMTGTIGSTQIADNAITSGKITANAIVAGKIAADAITADKVAANAITAASIAANAVTTAKLSAGSVTAATIAADAVTADKVAANAITSESIEANAITTAKIAAGAVSANEIAAGAVVASKVAIGDTTVLTIDPEYRDLVGSWMTGFTIVAGATYGVASEQDPAIYGQDRVITLRNVPSGTSAWSSVVRNAPFAVKAGDDLYASLGWWNNRSATVLIRVGFYSDGVGGTYMGELTLHSGLIAAGARTVTATGVVPTGARSARAEVYINRSTVTSGLVSDFNFGKFNVMRKSGGELIVDGAITAAKIGAQAITTAKIDASAVTTETLNASAITSAKIATGAITATTIATNAVTAVKIAADSVTALKIATNAVTTDALAANAVTANNIAANAVTAGKLDAGAVTAGTIAAGAVRAQEIAASAITASKLAIADFTNLVPDDQMQDAASWNVTTGTGQSNLIHYPTTPYGLAKSIGSWYYAFANNTDRTDSIVISRNFFPVTPGDELFCSAQIVRGGGTRMHVVAQLVFYDKNDVGIASPFVAFATVNGTQNQATPYSGSIVVPAGAFQARFRYYVFGDVTRTDGNVHLMAPTVRVKNNGELIVDGAITTNKILAGSITADSLIVATAAITTASIALLAVTSARIANASIENAKIDDAAITNAKIANAAITSAKIENLSVGTLKVANNAITTLGFSLTDAATAAGSATPQVQALGINKGRDDPMPIWYGARFNPPGGVTWSWMTCSLQLLRNGTIIDETAFEFTAGTSALERSMTVAYVDTWTGTGPVTYTMRARVGAFRRIYTTTNGSSGQETTESTVLMGYGTVQKRFIGALNALK